MPKYLETNNKIYLRIYLIDIYIKKFKTINKFDRSTFFFQRIIKTTTKTIILSI